VHGRPAPVADIARAATDLAQQEDAGVLLDRVVHHACELVPGCEQAGVVLTRAGSRPEALAATGSLAAVCGHLECELGEGPARTCADHERTVRADDVANDPAGPRTAHAPPRTVSTVSWPSP
jgi:hypothetical protein